MWKLLRGTMKHCVAVPLELGCDKIDWLLRAMQLRVYDLMDIASSLHMDAHDDLGVEHFEDLPEHRDEKED